MRKPLLIARTEPPELNDMREHLCRVETKKRELASLSAAMAKLNPTLPGLSLWIKTPFWKQRWDR